MTSDDRRRDLLARADALRARQAERMEALRREQVVARFMRWHGPELDGFRIEHRLAWPWEHPAHGPLPRYAFAFSGIDWALVPEAVVRHGGTATGQAECVGEAFESLGIAPDCGVQVTWAGGDMPDLLAGAADVARHAEALIDWGIDMWVFDPAGEWIVEVYHEGTVGHAPRPGLPAHAGCHWDPRRRRAERRALRDAARAATATPASTGDAHPTAHDGPDT